MDRLPRDILQIIAKKISHHIDVLRVAAVCKQCHFVVMDNLHLLPPTLPLSLCLPSQRRSPLLLQCRNGDEEGTIDYLYVPNYKSYGGFLLPEISRKWIVGSSSGWLVVIEINGQGIQLLNPLTRAQIPLPSLSTFCPPKKLKDYPEPDDFAFVTKIAILGDPKRSDDCMAMAIVSSLSVLSFCRLGDDKWTNIEGSPVHISDVIPYKGRFYAITLRGSVVAWDATLDGNVEVMVIGIGGQEKRYLVESTTGELLHIKKVLEESSLATDYFVVYKLEAVDEAEKIARTPKICDRLRTSDDRLLTDERITGFQWVELESLGDQALFLGHSTSFALSADSVPGCRRNCIYFTDDDDLSHTNRTRGKEECQDEWDSDDGGRVLPSDMGLYDMGLYDVEDGSIESFGGLFEDKTLAVPPVWILPSL